MPRLDETDSNTAFVLDTVFHVEVEAFKEIACPIDVCAGCYADLVKQGVRDDVAHPPYDEQHPPYTCAICGSELGEADDEAKSGDAGEDASASSAASAPTPPSTDPRDNPWIQGMADLARSSGLEMGVEDVRAARDHQPIPCGTCGGTAYYKPTVGSYVCPECGAIRVSGGEWTERRWQR